jgi:hypothetical protein
MSEPYIPQSLSVRQLIFAPEDENDYCDRLLDACPELRFGMHILHPRRDSHLRPPSTAYSHVAKCPTGWLDLYFTQPGWRLEYVSKSIDGRISWDISKESDTWPNGYWQRTIVQQDWIEYKTGERIHPHIGIGQIVFRARTDHPDERKLVAKLLRLASKVATNKYQIVFPNEPARPPNIYDKGGIYWIGRHAAEWVRQHPDRVLSQGSAHHGGYLIMPLD